MNPLESNQEYNKVNKEVFKLYQKSAYTNDARDIEQYGIVKGGSVFKSQKEIDNYIKKITQSSNSVGSAVYSKKKVGKGKTPPQLNKWQKHLESVRKANPELSLKEAMQEAKCTYEK